MKNENFVLLIMNCEKYRHKAERQQEWLKNVTLPYFHVIGNEHLETPYKFEDKTLYVRTPDDYCSLPKKVIAAFEAVHQEYTYQYIFKTDDDQFLTDVSFFSRLIEELRTTPNVHYGGRMCHITEECISGYWRYHDELPRDIQMYPNKYCNGRFYILSNEAVANLIEKKENIGKEYLEDYATGFYLDDKYKFPMFSINNDVFIDF